MKIEFQLFFLYIDFKSKVDSVDRIACRNPLFYRHSTPKEEKTEFKNFNMKTLPSCQLMEKIAGMKRPVF